MSGIPTIKLAKQIGAFRVIQSPTFVVDIPEQPGDSQSSARQEILSSELENLKQRYARIIQTLEAVVGNLQRLYEKAIVENRQGIAKLAVEIARKILVQKVKEGDYQIETIVQEALNNAPTRQDVVVRMNPQDITRCQEALQRDGVAIAGVKFAADPGIGPAECVVETAKGKIESLIEEHLEQVGRALVKAV